MHHMAVTEFSKGRGLREVTHVYSLTNDVWLPGGGSQTLY